MSQPQVTDSPGERWVFAYGSLIWRPGFPYERRVRGVVRGWARRFWQGSTDHRGVPGAPGRVVTLLEDQEQSCWGVAYQLTEETFQRVLSDLDVREQGGYSQRLLPFEAKDRDFTGIVQALTYVALEDNPHFLGPAPAVELAEQIRNSIGPSGHNVEYVLRLAEALDELNVVDEHVFELANLLGDTDSG